MYNRTLNFFWRLMNDDSIYSVTRAHAATRFAYLMMAVGFAGGTLFGMILALVVLWIKGVTDGC